MNKLILIAALLFAPLAYAHDYNAINEEVAAKLNLTPIPLPKIKEDCSVVNKWAIYRIAEKTIYHCGDIGKHIVFHEFVHHYQWHYKERSLQNMPDTIREYLHCSPKQVREMHAMLTTWEWCERNDCPSHRRSRAERIMGCYAN